MSTKFDEESQASYDWRMTIEHRLDNIEADIATMKLDIAFLKANGATKTDIAELRGDIKAQLAEAKSSIIVWVVGSVFLAQLLPALLKLLITG
ncbi:hypothetical protein GJ699_04360 [Duganella sp. FT80W]|uniref:DUF1640 domain-containing protein n=1 Tax=Duganella guangzhouensis TaxID=2666084 RepID=A0A6I2KUX3_9BURK|nr:hypothetical protein [Duganella guangzhouensis]MRW89210.1 hypothetical protein [Duganella guangzhouensis]